MVSTRRLIYNDNVTIVSCGPEGLGSYDERGFLTDKSDGFPPLPDGPPD